MKCEFYTPSVVVASLSTTKNIAQLKSLLFSFVFMVLKFPAFFFRMKPRKGFVIFATVAAVYLIGVAIAQESLFECPRGKSAVCLHFSCQLFVYIFLEHLTARFNF